MRAQKEKLKERGIIYTGFWEPIHFIKQMGRAGQATESMYDFIKSEDFVKYLADLGVNQLWSNFSKGYGLTFEDEEQQKIRALCEYAGKYDMQVIAYCTGGSLTPETVKLDFPDKPETVEDMVVRRADGRWASYGNNGYQNWRARPDYTSPDYMEWQKKTVKKALDFGCDGIHFDNTNILPEPAACRCARCDRMFHEFLEEQYSGDNAAAGMERWGRTEMQHTTIPWYDEWNDPVMHREVVSANTQAWLMFRQKIFNECLSEWADYIHELGGICEYNCGKNPGSNYRGYGSINDEVLLEKADIVFNEGTYQLGYNAKGSPITRVRSHKITQTFDIPMMNYNRTPHMMAEAFSFNPGMLGMWSYNERPDDSRDKLKFFDFYRTYDQYQTRQSSLAETAVFMHNESLTFSMLRVYMSFTSVTQLLQEEVIPYNLIYKKDLDDLSAYKLIVVVDAYCLKEWEADKLAAYVKAGGRLLSIGRTGERTDNFLLRTKVKEVKSLEDLYCSYETENIFTPLAGEDFSRNFVKQIDQGMVAHIRELAHAEEPLHGERGEYMIRQALVNAPANREEIMHVINELLPQKNIEVSSEADLLVDLCRRTDTGEGLAHIFNISWDKGDTARAEVEVTWEEPVDALTWIGWDREETEVPFKDLGNGRVRFQLKDIRESAVVIINKK
ncbi:hypothetical protein ACFL4W_00570 [Planctomycetota bacterium]